MPHDMCFDAKAKKHKATKRLPLAHPKCLGGLEIKFYTEHCFGALLLSLSFAFRSISADTEEEILAIHNESTHTHKYHIILFDIREKGHLICK